jgi:hypothetical protein
MIKKYTTIFFLLLCSVPVFLFLNCCLGRKVVPIEGSANSTEALIIDHTCVDISQIPEYWIQKARAEFGIAFEFNGALSIGVQGRTNRLFLIQTDDIKAILVRIFIFPPNLLNKRTHQTPHLYPFQPKAVLGNSSNNLLTLPLPICA